MLSPFCESDTGHVKYQLAQQMKIRVTLTVVCFFYWLTPKNSQVHEGYRELENYIYYLLISLSHEHDNET